MRKEALKRQSTKYLISLERWYVLRWKRRMKLLNETTNDLYSMREVLKSRNFKSSELNNVKTVTGDVVQKV